MSWVAGDDEFDIDPDIDDYGIPAEALGLFWCSVTYCGRNRNGGFVPYAAIPRLPGGTDRKSIAKLIEAGWWFEVDGGIQIKSFLKYNPACVGGKISKKRAAAGSKGGQATAAARRQREEEGLFAQSNEGSNNNGNYSSNGYSNYRSKQDDNQDSNNPSNDDSKTGSKSGSKQDSKTPSNDSSNLGGNGGSNTQETHARVEARPRPNSPIPIPRTHIPVPDTHCAVEEPRLSTNAGVLRAHTHEEPPSSPPVRAMLRSCLQEEGP